jgi:hypothetical protein
MQGISYLTNDNGEKIAVQLDLKVWNNLWEQIKPILENNMEPSWTKQDLDKIAILSVNQAFENLGSDNDYSHWLIMPEIN